MKFVLNFDHSLCNHILLSALVFFGFVRLFMTRIMQACYGALISVKGDMLAIKDDMVELKTQWERSDVCDHLTGIFRALKNSSFLRILTPGNQD